MGSCLPSSRGVGARQLGRCRPAHIVTISARRVVSARLALLARACMVGAADVTLSFPFMARWLGRPESSAATAAEPGGAAASPGRWALVAGSAVLTFALFLIGVWFWGGTPGAVWAGPIMKTNTAIAVGLLAASLLLHAARAPAAA